MAARSWIDREIAHIQADLDALAKRPILTPDELKWQGLLKYGLSILEKAKKAQGDECAAAS